MANNHHPPQQHSNQNQYNISVAQTPRPTGLSLDHQNGECKPLGCSSNPPSAHTSNTQAACLATDNSDYLSKPGTSSRNSHDKHDSSSPSHNPSRLRHRISFSSTISLDITAEYSQDVVASLSSGSSSIPIAKASHIESSRAVELPVEANYELNKSHLYKSQNDNRDAPNTEWQAQYVSSMLLKPKSPLAEAGDDVQRDPFRDPITLHCRNDPFKQPIKIYQHSDREFTQDLESHFKNIHECLLRNIEDERKRWIPCDQLDFKLWYAGTSKEDMHPSVVVICREAILPQVEDVLSSRHILQKHNLVTQSSTGIGQWLSKRVTRKVSTNNDHLPRFYLLFLPQKAPPLLLAGREICSSITLENAARRIWSGAKVVRSQDGVKATLACVLNIGKDLYGLTTSHGFERDINNAAVHFVGSEWDLSSCLLIGPDSGACSERMRNLDWALIKLQDSRQWFPFFQYCDPKVQDIGAMALCHPRKERKVLILSSISSNPQTGILLCGTTYSSAASGELSVGTWSVELDHGQELQNGDSGSLVIDAYTRAIYGYVVALDFRGLARIMPMFATISQIESTLHATNVKILGPTDWSRAEIRTTEFTSLEETGTLTFGNLAYMAENAEIDPLAMKHHADTTIHRRLTENAFQQYLNLTTPHLNHKKMGLTPITISGNDGCVIRSTTAESALSSNRLLGHQGDHDLILPKLEKSEQFHQAMENILHNSDSNFIPPRSTDAYRSLSNGRTESSSKMEDYRPGLPKEIDHCARRNTARQSYSSGSNDNFRGSCAKPERDANLVTANDALDCTADNLAVKNFIKPKRKLDATVDPEPTVIETPRRLCHGDYTVGWICALELEMTAAEAMFDEQHSSLPTSFGDNNSYSLGSIRGLNVVITCLPSGIYGTTSAAEAASRMRETFPALRTSLLVGIGGGVPSSVHDIRLGDVVVGIPRSDYPAVIQYDFSRTGASGGLLPRGSINKPPALLLQACKNLQSLHQMGLNNMQNHILQALKSRILNSESYAYPGVAKDILYQVQCEHDTEDHLSCTCEVGPRLAVPRPTREDNVPVVHYGTIGSGNQVIKHGHTRDRLARQYDILCFEMESAGLMNYLPTLIIRGICDYCDRSKDQQFQGYAALAAAAYTKDLLSTDYVDKHLCKRDASSLVNNTMIGDVQPRIKDRQGVCDSLDFEEAQYRRCTIKKAHGQTCSWLLTQAEYIDWLDSSKTSEHLGLLWIKGKPGAGKSTLMKYILENAEKSLSDTIVASFFFNARGVALERSSAGMCRSILHQILGNAPNLQHVLDNYSNAQTENWKLETLQHMLKHVIEALDTTKLVLFIDALDECPEDDMRQVVQYLEEIVELAADQNLNFRVCLSSRHYPNVSVAAGYNLILEEQKGHQNDIDTYIATELRIGYSKQAMLTKSWISKNASQIFLYAVLAVRILKQEYDRGHVLHLHSKLKTTPLELTYFFRDILYRDERNLPECVSCMQWIIFAERPLRRQELWLALSESHHMSQLDADMFIPSTMNKFILDCSKGLAEVPRTGNVAVQFIHQSARDFLLREHETLPGFQDLAPQTSHQRLTEYCRDYIKLVDHKKLVGLEKQNLKPTIFRRRTRQMYPFLEYAVEYILVHAEKVEVLQSSDGSFIASFPAEAWMRLYNIIQQYKSQRFAPGTSMFYAIAKLGLPHLLASGLRGSSSSGKDSTQVFEDLVLKALTEKNSTAFRTLSQLCDGQVTSFEGHDPPLLVMMEYLQATRTHNGAFFQPKTLPTVIKLLQSWGSGDNSFRNEVLLSAASMKHEKTVQFLVKHGANINTVDDLGNSPLHLVVIHQRFPRYPSKTPVKQTDEASVRAMITILLDHGGDIELKNYEGRTALHLAVINSTTSIVNLLIERGASTAAEDNDGNTGYSLAVRENKLEMSQMLSER